MSSSEHLSFNTPAFLYKARAILNNTEYNHIISWDDEGTSIKILNEEQMEKTVLPKQFRHGNYNSFVRQLNMYGFKKMKKRLYGAAFSHPHFKRDSEQEQGLIKRRRGDKKNIIFSKQNTQLKLSSKKQQLIEEQIEVYQKQINDDQGVYLSLINNTSLSNMNPMLYYYFPGTSQLGQNPYRGQWVMPFYSIHV